MGQYCRCWESPLVYHRLFWLTPGLDKSREMQKQALKKIKFQKSMECTAAHDWL